MSRALANAVVARLRAQLEPAVTVYDGAVPTTPNRPAPKYVVVYPDTGPRSRDRLVTESSRVLLRFQLTSVGATRDNAQAIADLADAAVCDFRLTVPGWAPSPIAVDESLSVPIRPDNDVSPPVFYAIAQYLLAAVPA